MGAGASGEIKLEAPGNDMPRARSSSHATPDPLVSKAVKKTNKQLQQQKRVQASLPDLGGQNE